MLGVLVVIGENLWTKRSESNKDGCCGLEGEQTGTCRKDRVPPAMGSVLETYHCQSRLNPERWGSGGGSVSHEWHVQP